MSLKLPSLVWFHANLQVNLHYLYETFKVGKGFKGTFFKKDFKMNKDVNKILLKIQSGLT